MHEHGSLPLARQDGLLEEAAGEELLLYDQDSHIAHCLSPIAACVWRHCDGERDVAELAGLAGVSEGLVADALHELREKDLLDTEPHPMQSAASGVSRREAIVRGVRVGAAATMPLIVSAAAATPAMASSGVCENCKTEPTCCVPQEKSTCCCCETGVAITVTGATTCNAACLAGGHGNSIKEAKEMRAA